MIKVDVSQPAHLRAELGEQSVVVALYFLVSVLPACSVKRYSTLPMKLIEKHIHSSLLPFIDVDPLNSHLFFQNLLFMPFH